MTSSCLFCQPDDETLHRVYLRNETCYARFDNFPASPGHTQIVPLRHVDSFFDLTPQELKDAHALLSASRAALQEMHHPDAWNIGVNDGEAAGRTVHHLHIHLIPRHVGDMKDPRAGIRRGLPNGDPDAWSRGEGK